MARSSGIRRPRVRAACSAPMARRSLVQKRAVGGRALRSISATANLVDERRGLLPYRRHQDPGHPLLLQQAELAVLTGRRAGRAAEDQEVVGLVGGVLDAARQRREEGVVDVEDDQSDGLVASLAKLACRVVPDEA